MSKAIEMGFSHFLIVGPGGSGLTTALDIYADFGFITVGGVEPERLAETILPLAQGKTPVAFTLRVGPSSDIQAVVASVKALRGQLPNLKVLAVDAPEDELIRRYLRSEKRHAFEMPEHGGLQAAIAAEKKFYGPLKDLKDYSIDTSTTTPVELRHKIGRVLGLPIDNQEFTVYINTFGFKYGIPQDAELIFDMRFMTNPFYDESLRPLTGLDKPVRDFIFNLDHARNFFDKWADLIADMLPLYQAQGKTRLSIAVGCTGGKHRSVCMGVALAQYLQRHCPAFNVVITHREMLRWGNQVESNAVQKSACSVGDTPAQC